MRNSPECFPNSTLAARTLSALALGVATLGLSGCLAVGYSSGGGWFIWPGGLGLIFVVLLVVFLIRRG